MRVLALVVVLGVGSCTVGSSPPPGGGQQVDAPAGSAIDAPAAPTDATLVGDGGTPDGGFACRNAVAAVGNGHHNPGMNCFAACHNHGFTVAGTLYTTAAGTAPLAGATITVTDAAGRAVDIVSQSNGNFYTSAAVTFPVTAHASQCPSIQMMGAQVAATGAGCNQAGCHAAAGGAGRIHLP